MRSYWSFPDDVEANVGTQSRSMENVLAIRDPFSSIPSSKATAKRPRLKLFLSATRIANQHKHDSTTENRWTKMVKRSVRSREPLRSIHEPIAEANTSAVTVSVMPLEEMSDTQHEVVMGRGEVALNRRRCEIARERSLNIDDLCKASDFCTHLHLTGDLPPHTQPAWSSTWRGNAKYRGNMLQSSAAWSADRRFGPSSQQSWHANSMWKRRVSVSICRLPRHAGLQNSIAVLRLCSYSLLRR